nr:IS110 family transposase [Nocardia mangyaensis]
MSQQLWSGIDGGKSAHHCVVIDSDGRRRLSRKVDNDETALRGLIEDVVALADGGQLVWAIDLNHGGAALLITLLAEHDQTLLYIPGRTVYHASASYRGDGKSDAKDAAIIADQARMRRDLQPLRAGDEIATDLHILTARRTDLTCDRTRAFNRLRAQLLEYFPALERAFDYSKCRAAVLLLTNHNTPDGLRGLGIEALTAWLRERKARNAAKVAATAIAAAKAQHCVVIGQHIAAQMVTRLAEEVIRLDEEITDTDAMIEQRFRRHHHAPILLSMPGFGVLLSAEFLAATGGDMNVFTGPDRLAGVAGLAPVPRDSGRIRGNLKRPRRYDRRLLRACYMSALVATRHDPASRAYYQRKRAEGKRHIQAVIALARRRLNVLWAMLNNHTPYRTPSAATTPA